MTAVTVTGSVGGTPITFATTSPIQAALAQQILAAAAGGGSSLINASVVQNILAAITVDTATGGSVLTGSSAFPSVQVALDGQFGTYITGGSTLSTVVAADNSNSSIVNNNPSGGLVASTGAGGNVILGLAGANQIVTGVNGQDIIVLNGAANQLTSNGSDAVLVGGPSTITAGATGVDLVAMTTGTSLNFINGSAKSSVDSILGASGGTIAIAGPGNTSVTSGAGPEAFTVDTSSGNVTLNAALQTTDTLLFSRQTAGATGSSAAELVNNFAAGDQIQVHNVGVVSITQSAAFAGGSVLTLSDNSTVTFSNVSATTLQATTIKTV